MTTTYVKPFGGGKKIPKLQIGSPQWSREANALARSAVRIIGCQYCGGAVIYGYCCDRCGSTNPTDPRWTPETCTR